MQLHQAKLKILQSQEQDWFYYVDHEIEAEGNAEGATLREDPSIALRWGRTVMDNFKQDWIDNFSDKRAKSFEVWATVHGNPICQWTVVSADGARYVLPIAPGNGNTVGREETSIAELIHDLSTGGGHTFEEGMRYAGLNIEGSS